MPPHNPLIFLILQKNISFLIWKLIVPYFHFCMGTNYKRFQRVFLLWAFLIDFQMLFN